MSQQNSRIYFKKIEVTNCGRYYDGQHTLDFDDQLGAVKDFLSKQKITGISFIKNEKDQPFINGIHPEWSGLLPFTILYGKISGKILSFWEGKESENKFRAAIQLALNN